MLNPKLLIAYFDKCRHANGESLKYHAFDTTSESEPKWKNCGPSQCQYCFRGDPRVARMGNLPTNSLESSVATFKRWTKSTCPSPDSHLNVARRRTMNSLGVQRPSTDAREPSAARVSDRSSWNHNELLLPTQNRTIFISSVPHNASQPDFEKFLNHAGTLIHCDIQRRGDGGSRITNALASYGTVEEAQNAIRLFRGCKYGGRVLEVRESRDSEVDGSRQRSKRSEKARPGPSDSPPIANGSGIKWEPRE